MAGPIPGAEERVETGRALDLQFLGRDGHRGQQVRRTPRWPAKLRS
jgi:hypothetical protein